LGDEPCGLWAQFGVWDGAWASVFIFWLVILGVIVAGVVWFVRPQSLAGDQRRSTSLEVLEERYARGEINREEYLQKKRDILG
jgi:putative membrane protein